MIKENKFQKMPKVIEKPKKEDDIQKVILQFQEVTKQPELFLGEQPEKNKNICQLLKNIYKVTIENDFANYNVTEFLRELVVEEMEEEQIWQQLEMRNNHVLGQLNIEAPKLLNLPDENFEIRLNEEEEEEENQAEEDDEMEEEEDEENEDKLNADSQDDEQDALNAFEKGRQANRSNAITNIKKQRTTVVDDKFFKLSEMEEFLEAEDAKESRKQKGKGFTEDDSGVDYFADNLNDEDDERDESEDNKDTDRHNPNYRDFFDISEDEQGNESNVSRGAIQKDYFASAEEDAEEDETENEDENNDVDEYDEDKKVIFKNKKDKADYKKEIAQMEQISDTHSDNSDGENKNEQKIKSTFEYRQERLQERIKDYEEEVLGEKPWQLKGEIKAGSRPQNSLLEEILDFESTIRPAPIITEETTRRLEYVIQQRIKDQAWDDVELKVRPQQTAQDYRKKLVLDQEKSKQSLAQVYESEYQRELDKLDPNRDDAAAQEDPLEHKEIRRLMTDLFTKIDALSNFHFVPKPVAPEAKIITNTPAVNMEEVAPIAVSDAKLLAPEEVFRGPKHDLLGKSERTSTDKLRERRKKKQKQRAINKIIEAKDLRRQKLGVPLSKKEENSKLMKTITKNRNVKRITTSNDQGSLKSSKAFFSKLQDQSTTVAQTSSKKGTTKRSNEAKELKSLSAKKLKL